MASRDGKRNYYLRSFQMVFTVQSIVTVHYQRLSEGYTSGEEAHSFWELIYCDKARVQVFIEGQELTLKQGEAVFVRPDDGHFVRATCNTNIFILSFDCRSKSMEFFANRVLPVPENERFLLETIMAEAERAYVIPDFDPALNKLELREGAEAGGEQIVKNLLEVLLIHLLRTHEALPLTFFVSKAESGKSLPERITEVLTNHLYGDFSLDGLSEELHYGKTHLHTVFRAATGTSIYSAFLSMKVKEAKRLIREDKPLSEIAYLLHFNSLPHFNRIFRNYAGMTPGEYKKSIK